MQQSAIDCANVKVDDQGDFTKEELQHLDEELFSVLGFPKSEKVTAEAVEKIVNGLSRSVLATGEVQWLCSYHRSLRKIVS